MYTVWFEQACSHIKALRISPFHTIGNSCPEGLLGRYAIKHIIMMHTHAQILCSVWKSGIHTRSSFLRLTSLPCNFSLTELISSSWISTSYRQAHVHCVTLHLVTGKGTSSKQTLILSLNWLHCSMDASLSLRSVSTFPSSS